MQRTDPTRGAQRLAIVGSGRLGAAVASALRGNDYFELTGPLGRGADAAGNDVALLCVPDREIASAAALIRPDTIVGHCSGATGLEPLAHREAFSLHPLMTVTDAGADFTGATAAIDAGSERALEAAGIIATALQMQTVRVRAEDRVAYHAAASIASNFLVTLEAAAERLAATAGVGREALAPLVRATVENWAGLGAERALTGPVARGDELTVARQREAVAQRTPELSPLFEALIDATRELAGVATG
ncbi:MAG TPA: DUF2520 domain-containing protein [Solirubrobacteraceae bacterium]|nr:DUF2520 domain-containing protein [Solirubrobacteraceae bacterium]